MIWNHFEETVHAYICMCNGELRVLLEYYRQAKPNQFQYTQLYANTREICEKSHWVYQNVPIPRCSPQRFPITNFPPTKSAVFESSVKKS